MPEKSAVHRIMVKTPDEMYESNLNVNVDMMFGFTNYVRFNFTIIKFYIFYNYYISKKNFFLLNLICRNVLNWFGPMFKIHRDLTIF